MKKLKVKVIGIGGVGCCLLNVLPRYLSYQSNIEDIELTLIDGDSYEDDNKSRQSFARPGKKVDVAAEAIRKEFPNLYCWTNSEYVSRDNILLAIREGDVVFSCVDNHATRKLVNDRCVRLDNVVLFSGGNEYTNGNIQVHVRENGKDITLPIGNNFHREILNPTDNNPADVRARSGGCDQRQASVPQLLIMNNEIANLMLKAFYLWTQDGLKGENSYDEVYSDILTGKTRPVNRRK